MSDVDFYVYKECSVSLEAVYNVLRKKASFFSVCVCYSMKTNMSMSSNGNEMESTSLNTIQVSNIHDQFLQLKSNEVNGKNVVISNLEHCGIFLKGIPSSVEIKNLHGCVIIVGPCSSNVNIDECHQCEFALACQQLNVHTSDECDFYVHITTQPILDDCHHCRFAPYNVDYQSKQNDIRQSGLTWTIDYWDHPVDASKKSSDLETIDEDERKEWSLDIPSTPSI